ncbi:uncharacterized protein LOC133496941 isoform X2 [Syngnathoides biaculeatus]|uniref:uncharacterized protein LOC133496941 isoform X2 n=1 Tax=Syngnathoides biaculeatus TaxID=300417 RepID=UPI002ADE7424|nr:uncharacterized protein LOC133496941 isoform X2 [Syngnathoides biaculeatus]
MMERRTRAMTATITIPKSLQLRGGSSELPSSCRGQQREKAATPSPSPPPGQQREKAATPSPSPPPGQQREKAAHRHRHLLDSNVRRRRPHRHRHLLDSNVRRRRPHRHRHLLDSNVRRRRPHRHRHILDSNVRRRRPHRHRHLLDSNVRRRRHHRHRHLLDSNVRRHRVGPHCHNELAIYPEATPKSAAPLCLQLHADQATADARPHLAGNRSTDVSRLHLTGDEITADFHPSSTTTKRLRGPVGPGCGATLQTDLGSSSEDTAAHEQRLQVRSGPQEKGRTRAQVGTASVALHQRSPAADIIPQTCSQVSRLRTNRTSSPPAWWTMGRLLSSRHRGRGVQYLVGYGPEEHSWIPSRFVVHRSLIRDFHAAHPDAPGPSRAGRWGGGVLSYSWLPAQAGRGQPISQSTPAPCSS